MHGDAIKIRLAGPPIGNAANQELVKYLVSKLSLNRQQIFIVGGSTSRRKLVEVSGLDAASVFAKLGIRVRED